MAIPILDLKAQFAPIKDEVMAAVAEVFESQAFVLGPKVEELEKTVATYSGCAHGVGTSSGTDALLLAMMAENIGPGDEVITTSYSFFATAGCIARRGARPVFVDIDPVSFNMDPAGIEAAITERTRAIMPVHLYGQVADMDPVLEIAKKHDLIVIEDAAQAIGAEYKGLRAGAFGHYACLSFFPTKNLGGAGDGGMVVTNDKERAERMRVLRVHGGKETYYHSVVGGNFRLDALQAAVLIVKFKYLDAWTEGRRKNADLYRQMFDGGGLAVGAQPMEGVAAVGVPAELPERKHIYNQFVIRVDRRDELKEFLAGRSITTAIYYPAPLHLQECFADLGYQAGAFPHSERAARETLALPVYAELTHDMITEIVDAITDFVRR
jgi:dTDP-4-amino-4,6-dideoxygalactose transaminase